MDSGTDLDQDSKPDDYTQKIFTLHRLGPEFQLFISVQDSNLSLSP